MTDPNFLGQPSAGPGHWTADAACRDIGPGIFFPVEGASDTTSYDEARGVCARCPVQEPCLAYALDLGIPDGVFGGLTPMERRKAKKGRTA